MSKYLPDKIEKGLRSIYYLGDDLTERFRDMIWDAADLAEYALKRARKALKAWAEPKEKAPERNEAVDQIAEFYETVLETLYSKMGSLESFLKKRPKAAVRVMSAAMVCFFVLCGTVDACTVYTYYYHGAELGTVKYKTMVEDASARIGDTVQEEKNINLEIIAEPEVDITYTRALAFMSAGDSEDEVVDKLSNCSELEGEGFAIKADDNIIAYVESEETANRILDQIKENYCTEAQNTEEVTINMNLEEFNAYIDGMQTETDELRDTYMNKSDDENSSDDKNSDDEDAADRENSGSAELEAAEDAAIAEFSSKNIEFTYKPVSKEGITIDNVIFEENVKVEPVTAKVADFVDYDRAAEIMMNGDGSSKILTVSTAETITYPEEIPFAVVRQETGDLYKGEVKVETVGLNGIREVTSRIIKTDRADNPENIGDIGDEDGIKNTGGTKYENGGTPQDSYKTEIIRETVILEPVDEVVLIGTAERPKYTTYNYSGYDYSSYGYSSGNSPVSDSTGYSYYSGSAPASYRPGYPAESGFTAPVSGTFTSPFGYRWGSMHTGVDIANSYGTPVHAAADGVVIYAQMTPSYGNLVKVDHGNGYVTYYAHNSSFVVSAGDTVRQGDVVALMGSTGDSTGNHCHFEIRYNGEALNPLDFITID